MKDLRVKLSRETEYFKGSGDSSGVFAIKTEIADKRENNEDFVKDY